MSEYLIDATLPDGTSYKVSKSMFNEVFIPLGFSDSRILIPYGGAGSGKSVTVSMFTILNNMFFDRNYFYLMKEKKSAEESAFNEVVSAMNRLGLESYYEKKQRPRMLRNKLNGRIILFEGCEDVENIKSLKLPIGAVNDIVMEEATSFSEHDLDQLLFRQRGIDYDSRGNIIKPRLHMVFNPVSKSHWIYHRFFANKWIEGEDRALKYTDYQEIEDTTTGLKEIVPIETFILHTTYKDNRFLSVVDKATYENQKDENMYRVYVLGLFGTLGKTVFKRGEHYEIEEGLRKRIHSVRGSYTMGLDFSGGIADHAFVNVKIDTKGKILYVYDDFGCPDLTIEELWEAIKHKTRNGGYIRCDVGNDMRKQIKKLGAPVRKARKGKGSILLGLTFLKSYRIIVDSKCTGTLSNLENYAWKKNKMGEYVEIPEDTNNDFIDALRYSVSEYIIGKTRKQFVKGSII